MNPNLVQESAVQFRGKRPKCQIKIDQRKVGAFRWDGNSGFHRNRRATSPSGPSEFPALKAPKFISPGQRPGFSVQILFLRPEGAQGPSALSGRILNLWLGTRGVAPGYIPSRLWRGFVFQGLIFRKSVFRGFVFRGFGYCEFVWCAHAATNITTTENRTAHIPRIDSSCTMPATMFILKLHNYLRHSSMFRQGTND